jgi:hypothetical protein
MLAATIAVAATACAALDDGVDVDDDALHDSPGSARPFVLGVKPGSRIELDFVPGTRGFYETYFEAKDLEAKAFMTELDLDDLGTGARQPDELPTSVFRLTAPSGASQTVEPVNIIATDKAGDHILVNGFNMVTLEQTKPGCMAAADHAGCYRLLVTTGENLAANAAGDAPTSDVALTLFWAIGPFRDLKTTIKI